MAYVVGLTGGIGSGKSEVTKAFAALGADVADADAAAHAVTARDEPGFHAVVAAFGPQARAPPTVTSIADGCGAPCLPTRRRGGGWNVCCIR